MYHLAAISSTKIDPFATHTSSTWITPCKHLWDVTQIRLPHSSRKIDVQNVLSCTLCLAMAMFKLPFCCLCSNAFSKAVFLYQHLAHMVRVRPLPQNSESTAYRQVHHSRPCSVCTDHTAIKHSCTLRPQLLKVMDRNWASCSADVCRGQGNGHSMLPAYSAHETAVWHPNTCMPGENASGKAIT